MDAGKRKRVSLGLGAGKRERAGDGCWKAGRVVLRTWRLWRGQEGRCGGGGVVVVLRRRGDGEVWA